MIATVVLARFIRLLLIVSLFVLIYIFSKRAGPQALKIYWRIVTSIALMAFFIIPIWIADHYLNPHHSVNQPTIKQEVQKKVQTEKNNHLAPLKFSLSNVAERAAFRERMERSPQLKNTILEARTKGIAIIIGRSEYLREPADVYPHFGGEIYLDHRTNDEHIKKLIKKTLIVWRTMDLIN